MIKQIIHPKNHPKPRGAYSPAIKITTADAETLYVTGQLAMDGEGQVIAPDDVTAQSEYLFALIGTLLEEAGMNFSHVVKAQTYLTNMADFPKFSAVRNRYFAEALPAHTLLEVKGLAKPGCCVEVEVTAVKG